MLDPVLFSELLRAFNTPLKCFRGTAGSSEFRWAVARRTVKVDAVLGFENAKAFGNSIHFDIGRTTGVRKLGSAGPFALWTPQHFNPMVDICHPSNIRLRRSRSTELSSPQSLDKIRTVSVGGLSYQ